MLCDANGLFPAEMNNWETEVLKAEMERDGFLAWYRNPSRASQDSLGISYIDNTHPRILRPDFIFFSKKADDSIVADIVDPHGTQLSDALPKLRGLAQYAEEYEDNYRRIDSLAMVGDKLKVLDLTSAEVRKAIMEASDAKSLYAGPVAVEY
jgi:hypothetical protein